MSGDPSSDAMLSSSSTDELGVAEGRERVEALWAVVVPPEARWGDGAGREVGSGVTDCHREISSYKSASTYDTLPNVLEEEYAGVLAIQDLNQQLQAYNYKYALALAKTKILHNDMNTYRIIHFC